MYTDAASPDLVTLAGTVEGIRFHNTETGFTIMSLRPDEPVSDHYTNGMFVTVVGNLVDMEEGMTVGLKGVWTEHPKYGWQFKASLAHKMLPTTIQGLQEYLGGGSFKGIREELAKRIIGHFGDKVWEILDNTPGRISDVKGISAKVAAAFEATWIENRAANKIMPYLFEIGLSGTFAVRIYRQYGQDAIAVIQTNPYQLAYDIDGIGFKKADALAMNIGLSLDHPGRIEAGILYVLDSSSNEGHTYLPIGALKDKSLELLGDISPDLVIPAVKRLRDRGAVRVEDLSDILPGSNDVVYRKSLYDAEFNSASKVRLLLRTPVHHFDGLDAAVDPELTEAQAGAVDMALHNPISILTGGPGTGKSFSVRELVRIVTEAGKSIALAAPTGRAAKRVSELSDYPAQTIHRLLELVPGQLPNFNDANPLDFDMIVVDEASMIDITLFRLLVSAVRPGTNLLLVGDIDQLPSVGPGNVLRDLIASGRIPTTRLTEIFRQVARSKIIMNAHLVNAGGMPESGDKNNGDDFFLFPVDSNAQAEQLALDIATHRIPETFGIPPERIQVLSPYYKGPAGIISLNARLQAALNSPGVTKSEKEMERRVFRTGDRVMQLRNNYDKGVYNGDIGYLREVDQYNRMFLVDFGGTEVQYDFLEADQLTHAFCCSVHKSQGSEFDAVVILCMSSHYMLLQRNLLYTAITRAKKLCVLVAEPRAVGIAVGNNKVERRFTALGARIAAGE